MTFPVVAILAPGAMGAGIGAVLRRYGLRVIVPLAGRSPASRDRAHQAGLTNASPDEIAASDFILSIVPPAEAAAVAEQLSPVLHRHSHKPVFVECNAVDPRTVQRIAAIIAPTGCAFVDAGIIGLPPQGDAHPAIYASGGAAGRFAELTQYGLDVRVLDGDIGAASALKMSYAGITKGLSALGAAMMLAATRAGAATALRAELASSQPQLLAWFERQMPRAYPKMSRWVGEMEEIAAFVGDDPAARQMFEGIADLYRRLADDVRANGSEIAALRDFTAAKPA